MKRPIRVLTIDDDPRLHTALVALLTDEGIQLETAANARQALASVDACAPDVAVVDLGLPDMDGVALIAELARRAPTLPMIVLTFDASEARIVAALRAGASGYLLKADLGARLRAALDEVMGGGAPLSSTATRAAVRALQPRSPEAAQMAAMLTGREREVLQLLALGATYADVARGLGIGIGTVQDHVKRIYGKLGIVSKAEAALVAARLGLV